MSVDAESSGETAGDATSDGSANESTLSSIFGILAQKFRKNRAPRTIVYHFCIDEQDWTLVVGPENFELLDGKPSSEPDCYLKTSGEILNGTLRGEYSPSLSDLLTGKVRATNPQMLLTLRDVFSES